MRTERTSTEGIGDFSHQRPRAGRHAAGEGDSGLWGREPGH